MGEKHPDIEISQTESTKTAVTTEEAEPKKSHADSHATYYASSMLSAGYSKEAIRQELERNNYSSHAIDETFRRAKKKRDEAKKQAHHFTVPSVTAQQKARQHHGIGFNEKLFIALYSFFVFFLIAWINIQTQAPLLTIFVSFLPTFAIIIISLVFFSAGRDKFRVMVWAMPIFTSVIWYGIAASGQVVMLTKTDYGNITILNFALSMLYLLILDLFNAIDRALIQPLERKIVASEKAIEDKDARHIQQLKGKKTTKHDESHLEKKISLHSQEQQIEKYIQSIEDKSKALNFVIGRVYSQKHGGSDRVRGMVRIDKEWYNIFSEVPPGEIKDNIIRLKKAVYSIGERLNVMSQTEKEVFATAISRFTNLTRDADGNDRIIDVMINNDKDPVATYYQSAVEFCNKAAKEIELLQSRKQPKDSAILESNIRKEIKPE